ncbi:MAG: HAMP domain-containing sensor histidine kinase, partial [Bacteroidota bacterium]
ETLSFASGKITEHGQRAEKIVKSMLMHSRKGSGAFEDVQFNDFVSSCVDLSAFGAKASISATETHFNTNYDPGAGSVSICTQEVSRVIINLINNSLYALQKKKQQEPEFQPVISITTEKEERLTVLKIKDNGTGIPENVIKKIFDPFFTTKPAGEGTGLGLSLSYEIVAHMHKGEMTVDSQPGEYTEFTIKLPVN